MKQEGSKLFFKEKNPIILVENTNVPWGQRLYITNPCITFILYSDSDL